MAKRGRPPYTPTEEQRQKVAGYATYGVPQERIAKWLKIDVLTLRKYYEAELTEGLLKANAKVGQTLFQMATSGEHPACTIFYCKTQLGMREKESAADANKEAPNITIVGAERPERLKKNGTDG